MNEGNNNSNDSFTVTVEDTSFTQKQEPQGPQQGKGKAIGSMVLGIVGIVFSCCIAYVTFPCAIISLILGILSLKNHEPGRGMALAGVIMSGLSLIGAVVTIILGAALISSLGGLAGMEDIMSSYGY